MRHNLKLQSLRAKQKQRVRQIIYTRGILGKFTPDIDFTNEQVVQCVAPAAKNTFVDE